MSGSSAVDHFGCYWNFGNLVESNEEDAAKSCFTTNEEKPDPHSVLHCAYNREHHFVLKKLGSRLLFVYCVCLHGLEAQTQSGKE